MQEKPRYGKNFFNSGSTFRAVEKQAGFAELIRASIALGLVVVGTLAFFNMPQIAEATSKLLNGQ